MSGKDPELSRLGDVLSDARAAYAEAKKVTDEAKARLNEKGDCIQAFNTEITALKEKVDAEYDAMRSERADGNREAADERRTKAQSLQAELSAKYEEKKKCFLELDEARAAFNAALDQQKQLRDGVQVAWDQFNERLNFLKAENAKEQAMWQEKPCKNCGTPIRYNVEWKHIPNLCRDCFEKDKANWEDRVCAKCGSTFRINNTWERIPTICPSCKKIVKAEKEARIAAEAATAEQEIDAVEA